MRLRVRLASLAFGGRQSDVARTLGEDAGRGLNDAHVVIAAGAGGGGCSSGAPAAVNGMVVRIRVLALFECALGGRAPRGKSVVVCLYLC